MPTETPNWVPDWAKFYRLNRFSHDGVEVHIVFLVDPCAGSKPIEMLMDTPAMPSENLEVKLAPNQSPGEPPSIYHFKNPGGEWLDFYDVWDALMINKGTHELGDSALGHAFKKAMAPGKRTGGKSRLKDFKEMAWTFNRAIEQMEQKDSA